MERGGQAEGDTRDAGLVLGLLPGPGSFSQADAEPLRDHGVAKRGCPGSPRTPAPPRRLRVKQVGRVAKQSRTQPESLSAAWQREDLFSFAFRLARERGETCHGLRKARKPRWQGRFAGQP